MLNKRCRRDETLVRSQQEHDPTCSNNNVIRHLVYASYKNREENQCLIFFYFSLMTTFAAGHLHECKTKNYLYACMYKTNYRCNIPLHGEKSNSTAFVVFVDFERCSVNVFLIVRKYFTTYVNVKRIILTRVGAQNCKKW